MNTHKIESATPPAGHGRHSRSRTRDLIVPGAAGLLLYAVNFYEAGLNAIRFFLAAPFAPIVWVSGLFIDSGLVGLLPVSVLLGTLASRATLAWAVFYLPAFVARFIVGAILFSRGEANLWPAIFFGEVLLGVLSLALFLGSRYVRDKAFEWGP